MRNKNKKEFKTLEEYRKEYKLEDLNEIEKNEFNPVDFGKNLAKESMEKVKAILNK